MSKQKPEPVIEPAILETKSALATGGPEKEQQQDRYTEAVQNDLPQQSLDNDKLTGEGAEGEKENQETVTIPAPQTDTGKPETVQVEKRTATATDSGTTLHDAIKGQQAQILTEQRKEYKWLDFGPHAHNIKIVSLGQAHYDVGGKVFDVTVAAGEEEGGTFTIPNVPERFLKE